MSEQYRHDGSSGHEVDARASAILSGNPALRGSPRAMAMMSAALHLQGRLEDAIALALAAVEAGPDDMIVHQTVRGSLNTRVDSFHESMIKDVPRNQAYAQAIERAVRPGMTVLEIGAGSGLLAMIAARAGARVVTCEAVPLLAATARAIVARNGYADRIRVVTKRSNDLCIGVDLDAPADLIIHEIFGEMLFNEGVGDALADARARLLKPGAPSVPPRAELRVALASTVRRPREPIGMVEGFDLWPFNILLRPRNGHALAGSKRIEMRSAPASALRADFDGPAPFGPSRDTVRLESTGGRVDAVVQWLRLDFGDGLVLENDPCAPGPPSSWVAPLFDLPMPIETQPGDTIDVTLHHNASVLTLDAVAAPR